MQDKLGPFTLKKIINPFFSSFSFSRGKEKEGLMEGEGELSGAFLKILHCIQDHKWNAKQGWEGCELRNKSEAIPLLTSLYKALLVKLESRCALLARILQLASKC